MTTPPLVRLRSAASAALASCAAVVALAQAPGPSPGATDRIKAVQTDQVRTAKARIERPYHFGSQGRPGPFSNHTSHSNRLIPYYTFGTKLDAGSVGGSKSVYRDASRLASLYGYKPENTLNPGAEYVDQSDFKAVLSDAVSKGVTHLFIVWLDGLDWPTTQAAAAIKTGKPYTRGKGAGLAFQDYAGAGASGFGYYVTAPSHDNNETNVNAQTVVIPPYGLRGGYDVRFGGPNPWTPGPLLANAPGYLKGQSADAADKAGVRGAGGVLHAYTDSSCSAAEFVGGRKSYNNSVNVTPDGTFTDTLFHRLQADGWRLGTVTSVAFDHASPAAMYAHNVHRDDYQDLAREMLGLPSVVQTVGKSPLRPGLDVVIGTGYGQIASVAGLPAQGKNGVPGNLYITDVDKEAIDVRNGGKYVVAETAVGVNGAKALAAAASRASAEGRRLFGFYGNAGFNHLPYRTADGKFDPAPDLNGKFETYTHADLNEQPTLADMTRAALAVLGSKPGKPFALFVEAGDVDFALHANNLDNAVGAVYSGEDALKAVFAWVEANSNWDESAVIVAADHGHYLVIDDLDALAGTKGR